MSRGGRVFTLFLISLFFVSCVKIQEIKNDVPAVQTESFRKKLEEVGKSPFQRGNKVELLANGEQFFPKMLADMRTAKKSIDLETFIMMEGRVTTTVVDLLCAKAGEGVKVRVLLDAIGSRRFDDASIKKLKKAQVDLIFFRPFWSNPIRQNNRSHRKSLIVDSRVAHVGGAGIADAWSGPGNSLWSWRDNNYRVTGPVVTDMQGQFDQHWNMAKGGSLKKRFHTDKVQLPASGMWVQSIAGKPLSGVETVASSLILALNAAEKEVVIQMAYSCPPRLVKQAFARALKRGVRVRILSSGRVIDSSVCRRCAHHWWKNLIKMGAEIYEYQPAMMHAKLMVVDKYLTITGAANMDYRSYFLNDENSIHVLDHTFAKENLRQFEKDLLLSKRLTKEDVLGFSWRAWVMQSQL